MRADDVVGFHEGFLRNFPVAWQALDHVRGLVALGEGTREVAVDIAEEMLKRFSVRVRIDEHEAAPVADRDWGKRIFLFGHAREIPVAGHFLELAIEVPRPAVERAAQHLEALTVRIAQLAAAVEAGVGESLDRAGAITRGIAHEDEGQAGDLVDVRIADIGNVVLVAGHLPNALPQPLDFAVVLFAGVVAVRGDLGHAAGIGRFLKVDRRRRDRIGLDHFEVGHAGCAVVTGLGFHHLSALPRTLPVRSGQSTPAKNRGHSSF